MNQAVSVEQFIVDYLLERGADIDPADPRGYNFVSSGVIDSFEVLALLLVLKQTFGVSIEPEDFVDKQYHLVGKLIDTIEHGR